MKMNNTITVKISGFSLANLQKFSKALRFILDTFEIQEKGELKTLSPIIDFRVETLRREGLEIYELKQILKIVNKIHDKEILTIIEANKALQGVDFRSWHDRILGGVPEHELSSFIIIEYHDWNIVSLLKNLLKKIERRIDKKFGRNLSQKSRSEIELFVLKKNEIDFDKVRSVLLIGNAKCSLPPYKNEYDLCKVMFEHQTNEPVSWDEVYEEMTEKQPDSHQKNTRTVQDAMYALNKRVQRTFNTGDELFSWKNKTIIRNF